MLGAEPAELVGRLIPELTHPDDIDVTEGTFDEIAKPGVESLAFEGDWPDHPGGGARARADAQAPRLRPQADADPPAVSLNDIIAETEPLLRRLIT
jgi:hypothetical protein